MASHRSATFEDVPYVEPNPLPSSIPKVDEVGATSAPLKSASFAIGEYCREVNGTYGREGRTTGRPCRVLKLT
jgi:NADH dehydrogenase (ubiquinone) 1 alpha subcomplex subunit 8